MVFADFRLITKDFPTNALSDTNTFNPDEAKITEVFPKFG